jgi:hypothetical protein
MKSFRSLLRLAALVVLLGLSAAACNYPQSEVDDPVSRRFSYLSYLAADDLRESCTPSSGERYRFVYNAEYNRQVRLYEIGIAPDRQEGKLEVRVLGGKRYGVFQFGFKNWLLEQAVARTRLQRRDVSALYDALERARFGAEPRHGLELWSDSYYWLVSSCHEGNFHQQGYLHPSREFAAQDFAGVLAPLDRPGVPFVAAPGYDPRVPSQRRRPRSAEGPDEGGVFVYTLP